MGIALIGFMGAGKSTAAAKLAQCLGVEAMDADMAIEARLGHTVAEEFETAGEAAFRELEERVVLEMLASAPDGTVMALGGGSVLSQRVRDALAADHLTVLLEIDVASAWERVRRRGSERPLASDRKAFAALHARRAPLYESIADAILPSGVDEVALKARPGLEVLAAAPAGTRMVWACAQSGEYPVLLRGGLLRAGEMAAQAGRASERWSLVGEGSRPFCVSDRNVAAIYGELVGDVAATVEIEPGERSKTLATAERVWGALAQEGMTRADHVLAVGGGVVGDLAGFCAATYQRGVPVVHVPTTLVAQVDSAYGGKTGVDLPEAKNYVGAYHQPAGVIVDPEALQTLPPRELAAGWVEVIKTALIRGGALWEDVCTEGAGAPSERTILACLRTKLAIVQADERDGGTRRLLNLGHTVGHAIEAATAYGRYLHGEAVGLGLLAALSVSGLPRLRETVRELLARRQLPTEMQGVEVERVMAAIGRDKKRLHAAELPFVIVREPGEVAVAERVDRDAVAAAVAELIG